MYGTRKKKIYYEKIHNLEENLLEESEANSLDSQKNIWKQSISKQATIIECLN